MHFHPHTLLLGVIEMLAQQRCRLSSVARVVSATRVEQRLRRVRVLADESKVEVRGVEKEIRQSAPKLSPSFVRPKVDVDHEAVDDSKDHGDGAVDADTEDVQLGSDFAHIEGVERGQVEREEDEAR
jgi:hypothetical protein